MWGHTRLFTDSSVMWCVMVAPYTPLCSVCVCVCVGGSVVKTVNCCLLKTKARRVAKPSRLKWCGLSDITSTFKICARVCVCCYYRGVDTAESVDKRLGQRQLAMCEDGLVCL